MSLIRLLAVFPDGVSKVIDVETKTPPERPLLTYFNTYQNVHLAELVVSVNLTTGETQVLKNRYGDRGRVQRRLGVM